MLVVSPFTTGYLLGLGIRALFAMFAVMAFAAMPFVAALRGRYALKYVEAKGHSGHTSILSLFRNPEFNWVVVAALAYTIPFFIIFSFGYELGKALGFSASEVYYLLATMFVGNVLTKLAIRLKSPITNRGPYMITAVTAALLASAFLALSTVSRIFFVLVIITVGVPDGITWTLGLQIANTSFKREEIATSTSFFSSIMMIMSAPLCP